MRTVKNAVSRTLDEEGTVSYTHLDVYKRQEVFSAASTLTYKSGDPWGPITQHSIILMVGAVIVVLMHNLSLIHIYLKDIC